MTFPQSTTQFCEDESGQFVVTTRKYFLGQETGAVKTVTEVNMVTWVEYVARAFVVSHLGSNGSWRSRLSDAQWRMCYVRCDGFGSMTYKEAHDIYEYDWSHIRDSSPQSFVEIANMIIDWYWTDESIEVTAARILQAAQSDPNFDAFEHIRGW